MMFANYRESLSVRPIVLTSLLRLESSMHLSGNEARGHPHVLIVLTIGVIFNGSNLDFVAEAVAEVPSSNLDHDALLL